MDHQLAGAQWIARPVPRAQRITRHITRSRIDWVEPGHTLAQRFTVDGPVTAVNIDLVGPEQDRYTEDVKYVVTLQTAAGETVAERHVEGSQAVWDYFGQLLDVTPPAPAGDYVVALRSDRGTIGWSSSDAADKYPEDGISPLPILGAALRDDQPVSGVRMIGVDTIPAPNPLFRRTFSLDSVPESALLAATVLGIGEVRINGARVGDETLEPAVTDYTRTVLYRTWEVGHLLRDGDNEILIEAGRERYAARGGDVWGWSLAPWHREPVAVARLEITDQAGAVTVVVTDESWTTAMRPCRGGAAVSRRGLGTACCRAAVGAGDRSRSARRNAAAKPSCRLLGRCPPSPSAYGTPQRQRDGVRLRRGHGGAHPLPDHRRSWC